MQYIILSMFAMVQLLHGNNFDLQLLKAKTFLDQNKTKQAIEIYKQLDSDNIVEAKYNLGMIYGFGVNGIKKEKQKAKRYLAEAALAHHKKAPYYLALLLSGERDANKTKILLLIMESAVSGFDKSQFEYGKILFDLNKTEDAKVWIQKACKQGNRKAQKFWKEMQKQDIEVW